MSNSTAWPSFQRATFLDGADVDEYVVAGLGLDEAVALLGLNHLTVPTGMLLALGPAPPGIDHWRQATPGGKGQA
jgi:hypothetical protein